MTCVRQTVIQQLDDALPLRLTLLILLLRPPEEDWLRAATWLTAGIAVAVPSFIRDRRLWFALAGLVTARLIAEWPLADNHIYLLAYWCLGVGLALSVHEPFVILQRIGRWLLVCAFSLAVVWKAALAPDYLDGRFFRVTLLIDERFSHLARAAGGLDRAQIATNREALEPLPEGVEVLDGPTLVEPLSLRATAGILTWSAVVLELLVAVSFIGVGQRRFPWSRHLFLLVFCGATYAVAPVAGFGWLLVSLGLSQCSSTQVRLRAAYVVTFFVILIYAETGWVRAFLDLISPLSWNRGLLNDSPSG